MPGRDDRFSHRKPTTAGLGSSLKSGHAHGSCVLMASKMRGRRRRTSAAPFHSVVVRRLRTTQAHNTRRLATSTPISLFAVALLLQSLLGIAATAALDHSRLAPYSGSGSGEPDDVLAPTTTQQPPAVSTAAPPSTGGGRGKEIVRVMVVFVRACTFEREVCRVCDGAVSLLCLVACC